MTIIKTTSLDALVKEVMPLPTKQQQSYKWQDLEFEGGDKTDPTNERAQEAAYHAGVTLGVKTGEAWIALGFVGPRPYRKAQNTWADKSGLARRITRRTKEQMAADEAAAPKAEAPAPKEAPKAAPKAPAKPKATTAKAPAKTEVAA